MFKLEERLKWILERFLWVVKVRVVGWLRHSEHTRIWQGSLLNKGVCVDAFEEVFLAVAKRVVNLLQVLVALEEGNQGLSGTFELENVF